jgi:4-diphosphocytidyl-2-C-methyl-D-erythritol kinase
MVNIGIHVSTAQAFSKVAFYKKQETISELIKNPFDQIKDELINSFESSVFDSYPILNEIKSIFFEEGAVYAAMSGSGSTMYGIFKTCPEKGMFKNFDLFFEEIVLLS